MECTVARAIILINLCFLCFLWRQQPLFHDDVMEWKHFPVTDPLCGTFTCHWWIPAQRPVTRSFEVLFDLRLNKRLSKQSGCRRHRAHYDVIIMCTANGILMAIGLTSWDSIDTIEHQTSCCSNYVLIRCAITNCKIATPVFCLQKEKYDFWT